MTAAKYLLSYSNVTLSHLRIPQLMNSNSPNTPFLIGSQWAQQEGPILFYRPEGMVTLTDNQELIATMERIKREEGRLYLLLDAVHNAGQDPKGRAWSAKHISNASLPSGAANIRANFHSRVLLKLFVRAAQLLHRFDVPLEFFSTEEEARAYLIGLDKGFEEERSRGAL